MYGKYEGHVDHRKDSLEKVDLEMAHKRAKEILDENRIDPKDFEDIYKDVKRT